MRRLRIAAPLAILAAASLTACSVKAPPSSAWTIVTPDARATGAPAPAGAGFALGLARFTAAPELRRTDLTWRSSGGLQLNQTQDRWVDYPDRMLEEVVRLRLLQDGRFASVRPSPPAAGLDAVLHARVLDFTEWHEGDAIDVRVAIEWRLTRPEGGVIAQDVIRASAPLPTRSVSGAVEAYRDAARSVAETLASAAAEALPRP